MLLKKWSDIPEFMKNDEVKRYYDMLSKKRCSLFVKRLFDIGRNALLNTEEHSKYLSSERW